MNKPMKKTIVITGCSSGFGRCTAIELARRGWHVFATVRKDADRLSLLQEAKEEQCEANLVPLLCDITHTDQVSALADQVREILQAEMQSAGLISSDAPSFTPCLDALMNNAGTAYGGPIEILPLEDLRAQLEINVVAHVAVIQAFLPMLKAARGTIINISSISGRLVVPVTGVYSASKHALEAISDGLRLELAPFGVRVVIIQPGSSPTSIWKTSLQRSMTKLGSLLPGSPYERLLRNTIKAVEHSSMKGFPAQRVADLVVKILNSRHPYARYGVPASANAILLIRRLLPDILWDSLIRLLIHW